MRKPMFERRVSSRPSLNLAKNHREIASALVRTRPFVLSFPRFQSALCL
uniref:Uncharacterized protein n=1 Tax=Anguilla anguilla TaxID=7936 RepID=A0A0E9SGY5_ANGAN